MGLFRKQAPAQQSTKEQPFPMPFIREVDSLLQRAMTSFIQSFGRDLHFTDLSTFEFIIHSGIKDSTINLMMAFNDPKRSAIRVVVDMQGNILSASSTPGMLTGDPAYYTDLLKQFASYLMMKFRTYNLGDITDSKCVFSIQGSSIECSGPERSYKTALPMTSSAISGRLPIVVARMKASGILSKLPMEVQRREQRISMLYRGGKKEEEAFALTTPENRQAVHIMWKFVGSLPGAFQQRKRSIEIGLAKSANTRIMI